MANIRSARRSGLVLRGGRNIRETLWADVTPTLTTFAAGATPGFINITGAFLLSIRPWTVVRVRGVMHLMSDQEAASEQQALAYGVCVVSDQAAAIGITAIPTPSSTFRMALLSYCRKIPR